MISNLIMHCHINNIPTDKWSLVALAELFSRKHDFYAAIKYFQYIKENFDYDMNIDFRIIDQLICLNCTEKALELCNSLIIKNPDQQLKFNNRVNLINTKRAAKYKLNINFNNTFIDNNNLNIVTTGKNTEKFELLFSSKVKFEFLYIKTTLTTESIDQIIKPRVVIENQKYLHYLSLNVLNTKEVYLYDANLQKHTEKLITIELNKIFNVLAGQEGWLFLDNDTNASPDQFTGKKLIDEQQTAAWYDYFSLVNTFDQRCLILIPPSKEQVYSKYYPYTRAKFCPIDQLIDMSKQLLKTQLFYPIDSLANINNSYSKTDTHWSFESAKVVFKNILELLKINHDNYKISLQSSEISNIGDLGSKIDPPQYSKYAICKSDISKYLFFDNHLPTQGSITIYKNPNSIDRFSIIIFGDSFISAMLPLFVEYFSKVTVVRSNATVITSLITAEEPNIIIMEMTERFIIKAPKILKNIEDYPPCMRVDQPQSVNHSILDIDPNNFNEPYTSYINKYKEILNNL